MPGELVCVSGGSGFIATHCILQLIQKGYRVRTTLRSLSRKDRVVAALASAGATDADKIDFVAGDLTHDDGWNAAVKDCKYVLHVASPFPDYAVKDENELIIPARDGTLRVMKAAKAAGVQRVVLTSSFAAIGYGSTFEQGYVFTEKDWTPTIAERAAWNFCEKEGGIELSVVNPVAVTGPIIDKKSARHSTSVTLIQRMLSGGVPALPHLQLGFVDVRDVADLHLRAMVDPKANGERFLCIAGQPMWLKEVAIVLKEGLGKAAWWVPTIELPSMLIKAGAYVSPMMRLIAGEVDKSKATDNTKAIEMLGWNPLSREESLLATAKSLLA